MLEILIHGAELVDEETFEITEIPDTILKLEHSLLAISKWESKWKKPFLSDKPHTAEETLDYIRCMSVENVDPIVFSFLTEEQGNEVKNYIKDTQSATTIRSRQQPGKKEVVTSELIYYWMTALNIPFTCEAWHLSRLMSLIQIAGIKNNPKRKKHSKSELSRQYHDLNEKRLAELNTTG